jgi:hypothetical protein
VALISATPTCEAIRSGAEEPPVQPGEEADGLDAPQVRLRLPRDPGRSRCRAAAARRRRSESGRGVITPASCQVGRRPGGAGTTRHGSVTEPVRSVYAQMDTGTWPAWLRTRPRRCRQAPTRRTTPRPPPRVSWSPGCPRRSRVSSPAADLAAARRCRYGRRAARRRRPRRRRRRWSRARPRDDRNPWAAAKRDGALGTQSVQSFRILRHIARIPKRC